MNRAETSQRNSDDGLKKKFLALQKNISQLKKRKRELLGLVNEDADEDASLPSEINMNFHLPLLFLGKEVVNRGLVNLHKGLDQALFLDIFYKSLYVRFN